MMQAGRRSQCALVRCLYTRALPENEIPPAELVDIYYIAFLDKDGMWSIK